MSKLLKYKLMPCSCQSIVKTRFPIETPVSISSLISMPNINYDKKCIRCKGRRALKATRNNSVKCNPCEGNGKFLGYMVSLTLEHFDSVMIFTDTNRLKEYIKRDKWRKIPKKMLLSNPVLFKCDYCNGYGNIEKECLR